MFQRVKNYLAEVLNDKKRPGSGGMLVSSSVPTKRGVKELVKTYEDNPWLHAAVSKIARDVSATPWKVYRFADNERAFQYRSMFMAGHQTRERELPMLQKEALVEKVESHPFLDLMYYGNRDMPGTTTIQVIQQHMELAGESFILKERNSRGKVVEIWPLGPHWVTDLPTKDKPWYDVNITGATSGSVRIPETEIIHIKEPSAFDPYGRGTGNAQAAGQEIEIDELSAAHVRAFFHNRARPDILVSADGISEDEARRVQQEWRENHQGVMNSYKPIVLNKEIDVKQLTQSFENMSLTNVRDFSKLGITQTAGLPPEKLGILSNSNRSTINESTKYYHNDVLKTRLETLRSTLQRELLPEVSDEPVIIDFERPELIDQEAIETVMQIQPGSFTINDFRKAAGFPTIGEEGDYLLIPDNHERVKVENPKNEVAPAVRNRERKKQEALEKVQHVKTLLEQHQEMRKQKQLEAKTEREARLEETLTTYLEKKLNS